MSTDFRWAGKLVSFRWAIEPGFSVEFLYQSGYKDDLFENQEVIYFRTKEELLSFLTDLEQRPEGQIHIFRDYGTVRVRRWRRRRLFGLFRTRTRWDRVSCFILIWYGQYANLTFVDDILGGEYCARDDREPAWDISDEIRARLMTEGPTLLLREECLKKARAFAAAREFIQTERRPEWLSYRCVGWSGYKEDLFENQEVIYFRTKEELLSFLTDLEQRPEGQIHIFRDYGTVRVRRWRRRRLFGLFRTRTRWDRFGCFTLIWYGQYANLRFVDDILGGEYHARDDREPAWDISDEIRARLTEEPTLLLREECLKKARAFAAAREFIQTERRPEWLSYRCVGG